jgi:L-alanine-DL-glutamate epimerase-like enolase superfamily enzyme
MWVTRREFDQHVQTVRADVEQINDKLDVHDARQIAQHQENQRLMNRIFLAAITGLAFAAWELLGKHLH